MAKEDLIFMDLDRKDYSKVFDQPQKAKPRKNSAGKTKKTVSKMKKKK